MFLDSGYWHFLLAASGMDLHGGLGRTARANDPAGSGVLERPGTQQPLRKQWSVSRVPTKLTPTNGTGQYSQDPKVGSK